MTTDSFVIYPDVCPVGYALRNSTTQSGLECSCKKDVYQILNCEDDQDTILIQVSNQVSLYSYMHVCGIMIADPTIAQNNNVN